MNELWYDDFPWKVKNKKILPIQIEYSKEIALQIWGVYFLFSLNGHDNDDKKILWKEMSLPHNIHTENIKVYISQKGQNMELKYVISNMGKSFENLEFTGEN